MTTILSTERIEEIRKRADAATEGPWKYEQRSRTDEYAPRSSLGWIRTEKKRKYPDGEILFDVDFDELVKGTEKSQHNNAAFIVASRTDIPDLLASHESLRLQLDEANARCVVDDGAQPKTNDSRSCTCHPSDNPPVPCAHQYAITQCRMVSVLKSIADIPTVGSAVVRADNDWIEMRGFAIKDVKHFIRSSIIDDARGALAMLNVEPDRKPS